MDESQKYYTKWKKIALKDYILNDSIYMIFCKRQKCLRTENTSVVARVSGGKEGLVTQEHGGF